MSHPPEDETPRGIFVGLATLDTAYRVEALPAPNAKITALSQELAAGGPAANAAVTFAALGGNAVLITAIGAHPLARHVVAELAGRGVEVVDCTPGSTGPPAVSSIYVVDATGDRSVVSVNGASIAPRPQPMLAATIAGAGVLVVDGHHPELALAASRLARGSGVPVVLDGGSWKLVLDELLPLVDVAICSADFRAPGVATVGESARELRRRGVPAVAVTRGGEPVLWWSGASAGEVAVPRVSVRDTLGAGDVFHGAFGYATSRWPEIAFPRALAFAAEVAAVRCAVPGLRAWLDTPALADVIAKETP